MEQLVLRRIVSLELSDCRRNEAAVAARKE